MSRSLRSAIFLALSLVAWPCSAAVDESPLPVGVEPAFPTLVMTRPIMLTGANDGTNRLFVPSQLGTIYVFANDRNVRKPDVFMDLSPKVTYKDTENEEGFLGIAFHPKFATNGEFFVYYTSREAPHLSIISRFRCAEGDHSKADVASEEEILRIPQPYWNHNGGTICFGPDGYLYVGLGDGGAFNDPHGNGQDLNTLLGKILRIDVDHKDGGKNYAIPKDNPFVGQKGAKPEIWAYGIRNVWRITFDRKTGLLWAADVGQDTWEEIDIIERGGNYGWNAREGLHKFTAKTVKGKQMVYGKRPPPKGAKLIDPIWEYHHDIGKSITGGSVYRGTRVPALVGKYVYADYVTGKIWALDYDTETKTVRGNHPIEGNIMPVMSFGEDDKGELYYMTTEGKLYWFTEKK